MQSAQENDPDADNVEVPMEQSVQVDDPFEFENVPGLHSVQAVAPFSDMSFPMGQSVQIETPTPPASLYDPGGHSIHEEERSADAFPETQAAQNSEPAAEYVPSLQSSQAEEPEVAWNVPGEQTVH